jgi:hypothetical protein
VTIVFASGGVGLVIVGVPFVLSYIRWRIVAFLIPAGLVAYGLEVCLTYPSAGDEEGLVPFLVIVFGGALLALMGAIGGAVAGSKEREAGKESDRA